MAFSYRKLLPENDRSICEEQVCAPSYGTEYCSTFCVARCPSICKPYPPLLSSPPTDTNQSKSISPLVIIIVAILGGTFLLVSYYAIIVKYCSSWTISRRSPPPQSDDTHEDFIDEDHGPVIDHPIWYIATVGLQQSIINSITVCKYKKEEGLVDGTQCSVCLNEFQEDESLRLLPKCSHAFHLPCIDTWLRSHTNCPLCRARIVYNPPTESPLIGTEPNSNNLGSGGETQVENPESDGGSGIDQVGGDGVSNIRVGTEDVGELRIGNGRNGIEITKECVPSDHAISEFRVLSNLADNRVMVEDDIQPLRRSVSMDSSSASMIFLSLANFLPEESEGSSGNQLVQAKKPNSEIVSGQGIGNSTIAKLIASSSMRRSLQKGPISMKRSLSCGGKFLFGNSRSRNSILPL